MNAENSVAIVDIGSNSIKLLVAARASGGGVLTVFHRTADTRISAGISKAIPSLSEEGMRTGVEAIAGLLAAARGYNPGRTALVATSAVRDAANGQEFTSRIFSTTGHAVRILSGEEEARLIGFGVRADPALRHLLNFNLFDLGGGSLECLSFEGGRTTQAISLPLGCVRLTERFVKDAAGPFTGEEAGQIAEHVKCVLKASGFSFGPKGRPAVFAGGSMTTARAVFASAFGTDAKESPTLLSSDNIARILEGVAMLPLAARKSQIAGLPPARADVFPAALATMLALAEHASIGAFHHTFYNLRYGLAAELLDEVGPPGR